MLKVTRMLLHGAVSSRLSTKTTALPSAWLTPKTVFCRPQYHGLQTVESRWFSNSASGMWFTKTHEYVALGQEEDVVCLGVTNVAVEQLGEIAYVELPKEGDIAETGEAIATVASVKAVGDVYSPVSGTVIAVNGEIDQNPQMMSDAEGDGWLCKIKLNTPFSSKDLLTREAYNEFCESEAEH